MSERQTQLIPIGVEKVLYLAAGDPDFRRALLDDPVAAVEAGRLSLGESELAMLRCMPPTQLRTAIQNTDVSPENVERRRFMRAVAAASATVVAAQAVGACGGESATRGIQPSDWREDSSKDASSDGGPPDGPETKDGQGDTTTVEAGMAGTGIRPG